MIFKELKFSKCWIEFGKMKKNLKCFILSQGFEHYPANQNVYKNMKTGDGFPRIFRCTVDGSVSGRGRPFRFEKRPQKSDSGTDNQKWIAVPSDE